MTINDMIRLRMTREPTPIAFHAGRSWVRLHAARKSKLTYADHFFLGILIGMREEASGRPGARR